MLGTDESFLFKTNSPKIQNIQENFLFIKHREFFKSKHLVKDNVK